jgi:hypothetical protein
MGEGQQDIFSELNTAIRPTFNGAIRVEARQERLTSDVGVVLAREVMDRIGMIEWLSDRLFDARCPWLITHPLVELLRSELLLLMQGWTDADDADFLRDDPAFRLAVSGRKQDAPLRTPESTGVPSGLPSQPTLSRFLAGMAHDQNEPVLQEANLFLAQQRLHWIDRRERLEHLTLDVDSLPVKVHGHQEGSAYNGYYHEVCYHPLVFGSADIRALFGARLRQGQVHTSVDAPEELTRYIDWVETYLADKVTIRGDAGFPGDDLLVPLEERGSPYVFRFKGYKPLAVRAQDRLNHYLKDLRERPDEVREKEFRCYEMRYQAEEWDRSRRVVMVIVPPAKDDLLPRTFFLVTNFRADTMHGELLVDLYRERGNYEDLLGQFMSTLTPQLSSTTRSKSHYRGQEPRQRTDSRDAFATNQAILSLNVLAFNVMGAVAKLHECAHRRPGRPRKYGRSSMRITVDTVRQYYLRVPARVTLHARSVWFSINEKAAELWQRFWNYLERLGYAPAAP